MFYMNCPLWVCGSANANLNVTVSFKDLVDIAESLSFSIVGDWIYSRYVSFNIQNIKRGFKALFSGMNT